MKSIQVAPTPNIPGNIKNIFKDFSWGNYFESSPLHNPSFQQTDFKYSSSVFKIPFVNEEQLQNLSFRTGHICSKKYEGSKVIVTPVTCC